MGLDCSNVHWLSENWIHGHPTCYHGSKNSFLHFLSSLISTWQQNILICCLAYTLILTERALGLHYLLFLSFLLPLTTPIIALRGLPFGPCPLQFQATQNHQHDLSQILLWCFLLYLRIVSNFLLHVTSELNDSIRFLLLPLYAYQSNEDFFLGCFACVCCVYIGTFYNL